ncbi:MAG: hypothetical protein U0941_21025 [Planctomycetaceae bacterium]
MRRVRLKFRWSTLWLISAAVISAIEIVAAGSRSQEFSVAPADLKTPQRVEPKCLQEISLGSTDGDSVLVIGNPGDILDGEVQVALTAVELDATSASRTELAPRFRVTAYPEMRVDSRPHDAPNLAAGEMITPAYEPICEETRFYFLQTEVRSLNPGEQSMIHCRLAAQTRRVKIFVDQRLNDGQLKDLIQSIAAAAESELADVVKNLAGTVRDVDQDHHLAVVITPEIARLGNGRTPVDGLTRPTDFIPELDRPIGNASDVIFLSSSLKPGDHLRAVLAHEWCHAAVFSRNPRGESGRGIDEDWINEAIAHVVEQRASGSATNLSHRIRSFLQNTPRSPLVVQDYSHPGYWRHDGCRGAGYLFMEWCLEKSGDRVLKELVKAPSISAESLAEALDTPLAELFRDWTVSLGQRLAITDRTDDERAPSPAEWRLSSTLPQAMKLTLGGTCASYVRIRCPAGTRWRISATVSDGRTIQTTLIPVETTSFHQ